jgi:hypothetical protein
MGLLKALKKYVAVALEEDENTVAFRDFETIARLMIENPDDHELALSAYKLVPQVAAYRPLRGCSRVRFVVENYPRSEVRSILYHFLGYQIANDDIEELRFTADQLGEHFGELVTACLRFAPQIGQESAKYLLDRFPDCLAKSLARVCCTSREMVRLFVSCCPQKICPDSLHRLERHLPLQDRLLYQHWSEIVPEGFRSSYSTEYTKAL